MKVIMYMAMSLNGMIAKNNDETPWSETIWNSYYKIAKKYKAIVLGRRTYEIMKEVNEFEKIGNPFVVVITNKNKKNGKDFVFVNSPREAVELLKQKRFNEILVGGGSKLNTSFLKENLIDEIYLDVEPVLISKGIPFINGEDFERKLELVSQNKIGDNEIQLHYRVVK